MQDRTAVSRMVSRRVGRSSRVDLEYFCRGCKGHFSTTVPLSSLHSATCRCGSNNLLVYAVAGEFNSPMRAAPVVH